MPTFYGVPSDGSGVPEELAAELAVDLTDTRSVLGAAVTARAGSFGVSDFVNSWWCAPRSVYSELRQTVYQGGIDAQGRVELARIDLRRKSATRVDLGRYEVDDHNVPAFLVEDDKPPIVAIVRHAVESFVRVRVGAARHDVESLATATEQQVAFPDKCTYAHLHRRPGTDTLALLTRVGSSGWWVRISRDWGATWEPAVRFHGRAYSTFNVRNGIAQYAITDHPTTSVNGSTLYLRISLETGVISNANGIEIGNLWTHSEVIQSASMTLVRQHYDTDVAVNSSRIFDVLPDGSILGMQLDKNAPEAGGEYGVYRYAQQGATSPNSSQAPNDPARGWTWEPIVDSGLPVGYYQSSYVGGMTAGANKDETYLCREEGGTWTAERWTRSGGTWTIAEELQRYEDGTKLGRPQVPWGAYGTGLYLGIEYHRYLEGAYHGYYGDEVVIETGTESLRHPVDWQPPAAPTGLQATAGPDYADLSWTAVDDAVAYDLYVGTTRFATVTGTTHRVTGLNPGQPYTYRIRAVSEAGNKSGYVDFTTVTPTAELTRDPILTDSGSLALIDPTNEYGAWAAGVPTATVPNLAAAIAAPTVGAAEGDLDFTVVNNLTGADGIVERTGKGALHSIITQSTGTLDRRFALQSEPLRAYMAANVGHSFYVSGWVEVTRQHGEAVPTPPERYVGFITSGSSDVQGLRLVTGNKLSVAPSAARIANKDSATPAPVDVPQLISAAHSSINEPTGNATYVRAGTGTTPGSLNQASSWILYRVYLEDLTVSGRTYAQVAAIDQSLFDAAFGAGGRYESDTYTAPSTLA